MEENDIKLRSEKTQHIIGKVPGAIVKWGISLIFVILVILIMVAYFIKIPNTLSAEIIERTGNGIKIISEDFFIPSQKIICTLRNDRENLYSGYAEITETTTFIKGHNKNFVYKLEMEIPDTIINGSNRIIIENCEGLKIDLSGERERLLYKLIPVLK